MTLADIRLRTPDLRQFASVRRIMLDDGPERGVRALAFSTGGGLDFWALSDRSLDIGPLWWRGAPIAWQGVGGFRSPYLTDPESEGGLGFLRSFAGLLVTCGLDHIRQPQAGHPLHGHLPVTPARLTAYGEDFEAEEPLLYCEGDIEQRRHLGEALRLRRRIEAPVGGSMLRIVDRVTNVGARPQSHQLLYHINFGHPALAEGSVATLNGREIGAPFRLAREGGAESAICFPAGSEPCCDCVLTAPLLGGLVRLRFDTATLPFLQLWTDPRPQHYVLGFEPCTSERLDGGASGPPVMLEPGETRTYRLELSLTVA